MVNTYIMQKGWNVTTPDKAELFAGVRRVLEGEEGRESDQVKYQNSIRQRDGLIMYQIDAFELLV